MQMVFGFSEAIAFVAVVVAFYYGWQNSKLTKMLIDKEGREVKTNKRAELSANIVQLSPNSYRLKIFNKGNASAKNVRVELLDPDHCVDQEDIDQIFPFESMEPQQGVDVWANLGMGSKHKHPTKLIWDDDLQLNNEKTVYPTF